MDFSTEGMKLSERYLLLNSVELIPVGTKCFASGDAFEHTKEIIVSEDNQKIVTMFWNSLYFLKYEDADRVTRREHATYSDWLDRGYL